MALLVLVGGTFACANTMFASVLARTREIGTLRALGYGPVAVGFSLLQEALLLGFLGGLVGFFAAGLFGEVPLKFPMGAFYLDLSPAVRLQGLLAALVAGFVGGLVPAVRAICWASCVHSPSRPSKVTASPGPRPGAAVRSMVVTSIDTAPRIGANWPPAITRPLLPRRCGIPSA